MTPGPRQERSDDPAADDAVRRLESIDEEGFERSRIDRPKLNQLGAAARRARCCR